MKSIQHIYFIIAAVSLLFALSLNIFFSQEKVYSDSTKTVFVLDVSQSMLVRDMDGFSRLESAKAKIWEIIQAHEGHEFALTIFAGESQRVVPFTQDIDLFLTLMLGVNHQNILQQGSNISAGLLQGSRNFHDESRGNMIILSDGGGELDAGVRKILKKSIHTTTVIPVGSLEGGVIPGKIGPNGPIHVTLGEESLQELALDLGAGYKKMTESIVLDGEFRGEVIQIGDSLRSIFVTISCIFWILSLGGYIVRRYNLGVSNKILGRFL